MDYGDISNSIEADDISGKLTIHIPLIVVL